MTRIKPKTAHLLLQITNQGEDKEEALSHLRHLARTAFYQMRENTKATTPQRISNSLTKDPQLLKVNNVINKLHTTKPSSSKDHLPKCSNCRLPRQPHHNNCLNCGNAGTVPYNTRPVIEYYLPDGGHWILDFAEDDVKHKYIDTHGQLLNDDDTAQLISSYLVPINGKFFTPPLPDGTTTDLMCASDFPDLVPDQPYKEENKIYGFHPILIEAKNTLTHINEVRPKPHDHCSEQYIEMLTKITSSNNTPLSKMIRTTLRSVILPQEEAKEERRTVDIQNKQHQYVAPTMEELQQHFGLSTYESALLGDLRRDADYGISFHPNDIYTYRRETLN